MKESERAVYLTFDDGPIPEVTPWVLDVLDRYGVKATFFVVGDNVRKYPDIFREVVRRGHSVGNHTYHHISGHIHGNFHFKEDVEMCQKIIEENLPPNKFSPRPPSVPPTAGEERGVGGGLLFRPPHGWMKPTQYHYVSSRYRVIMWDLVTRDYSNRLASADVLHNIKRYAREGSIITFHDSLKSIDKLRTALPAAIEWLQSEGYELKKL